MSDNIPEGISFAELQQLLEDAPEETQDIGKFDVQLSFDEICNLAIETKNEFFGKTRSPLAMKMILLMILQDMEDWHRHVGRESYEANDNIECLMAWYQDAGRIASLRETLLDIEVMSEDPTPRWKQD